MIWLWLYPLFVALALAQALIMRRLGMVLRLPKGLSLHLPACYAGWGIGCLVTILWGLDKLTYWWLFSLFVICFPFIYWGYIPAKKTLMTEFELLYRIVEISSKIYELGNKVNGTLKWMNR